MEQLRKVFPYGKATFEVLRRVLLTAYARNKWERD